MTYQQAQKLSGLTMKREVIIDTGIFAACLNRREKFHDWLKAQLAEIAPPVITCEGAVAETSFLLSKTEGGVEKLLDLLEAGFVVISLSMPA